MLGSGARRSGQSPADAGSRSPSARPGRLRSRRRRARRADRARVRRAEAGPAAPTERFRRARHRGVAAGRGDCGRLGRPLPRFGASDAGGPAAARPRRRRAASRAARGRASRPVSGGLGLGLRPAVARARTGKAASRSGRASPPGGTEVGGSGPAAGGLEASAPDAVRAASTLGRGVAAGRHRGRVLGPRRRRRRGEGAEGRRGLRLLRPVVSSVNGGQSSVSREEVGCTRAAGS